MSNKVIYIAFPGSGKTTLVKQLNKGKCCENKVAVDLDLPKLKSHTFNLLMDAWCLEYLMNDFTVFVHNYNMNYELFGDKAVLVFAYPLPQYKDEWLLRLKKRGDSDVFIRKVAKHWDQWIIDYETNIINAISAGCKVGVQILGPDEYLKLWDYSLIRFD